MSANPERFTPLDASFAPIHREAMAIVSQEFIVVTQEMLKAKVQSKNEKESAHLEGLLKSARLFLGNDIVDKQYVKQGRLKIHPQGGFDTGSSKAA